MQVEVRFDRATGRYVLTVKWADCKTETETFPTLDGFRRRVAALQSRLDADRWKQTGSPTLIAEDWWGPSGGH